MTVKIGQAVSFAAPIETKYAVADPATWHKSILPTHTSPVDLSFLNEDHLPAGKHGFIVAKKDQLEFEDGSPAKFWGTNIQPYALFSSTDEDIKLHAKRIAQFGYNLVRIHHHDSYWVTPNIFKNQKNNTLEFKDESLRKIDWWVKCLKDEGIYLWIDLQVGRQFTEDDGVDDFADFSKTTLYVDALGLSYYSSDLQSFMKDFNNAYLSRIDTLISVPAASNAVGVGSQSSQQIPPYKSTEIDSLTKAFNDRYFSLSLGTQDDFLFQDHRETNSNSEDIKSLISVFDSAYQPDNIKRPSEAAGIAKVYSDARGFNYYNESVQVLMKAFNQAYLSHVNEYTQLALKEDPAVISLLITNENDLSFHFGNALLADKNVPIHNTIFSNDARSFAQTHGLSEEKTAQTWEMGESKLYLNDVEHRFNETMMSHLEGLGIKSLVATTNSWGTMGLYSLPSLTDGSIIDVHSYGRANEFTFNPRYKPSFLTWIGAAQVSGKPLSVTEWNVEPFPAQDRFTAPIYTASIASLQGWDALMHYGYSQDHHWSSIGGTNYSSFNDPSMIGLMPAAALLYRQGHVAQANKTYELQLDRQDLFFVKQDPASSKTIRTLMETSRFTVGLPSLSELPWLSNNISPPEVGTIVVTDGNQDFIPTNQNFVESDTQELKRDWVKGIHTINTEKSQIISGWIGGELINLPDVKFSMTTKNAVVAVQSLENKAIRESNKIFITLMAQSQPETGAALPFISEPVTGHIEIYAPQGLRLYPINKEGYLSDKVNTLYDDVNNKYTLSFSADTEAHWYLLQDVAPSFRIISPAGGSVFREEKPVTIQTNFSQLEKAIARIDFTYDEGVSIGSVSTAPYEVSINSLSVGEHTLYAHIVFEDDTSQDAQISVVIEEIPFAITEPSSDSSFTQKETITIKTNAIKWDQDIDRVDFWKDNFVHLGGVATEPYEISVNNLTLGRHVLRARVLLDDGTFSFSTIDVTITPELSIGLPTVPEVIDPEPTEPGSEPVEGTPPIPFNPAPFMLLFKSL
jgi:hypothetical protein